MNCINESVEMFFLTVCLNPTLQKIIILPDLHENEVNRSNNYYLAASGKGINVSRVLVQLGEQSLHLTQAGGMFRDLFLILAKAEGIAVETVESNSEIRYCYTLCNVRKHTSTEIVEESQIVGEGTEKRIWRKFRHLLLSCHTLIISGKKATGFSDNIFPDMVRTAKKAGKRVICDFRGDDLKNVLPFGPDVVKPNFSEFCSTFLPGRAEGEQTSDPCTVTLVKEAMIGLYERYATIPVITRGRHDILFVEKGKVFNMPAKKIVPVNTIGCGDAFTAGFASKYRAGGTIAACVKKGRECAALNALQIRLGINPDSTV